MLFVSFVGSILLFLLHIIFVFFFKQKTAYEMRISDWSSDVCSSDLAAAALAPGLKAGAIISDVGSSKAGVADALAKALPDHIVIPAHPVAGTENSGTAAGFASLFEGRWCIVTPGADASDAAVAAR